MGITMAGKLQPLQVERLVTPGKYADPERITQAKTFQESVEACIDKQWVAGAASIAPSGRRRSRPTPIQRLASDDCRYPPRHAPPSSSS